MIIINFKNYKTGNSALKLAKKIQKFLPNSIVAVPALDIKTIAEKTKLKVFAQHVSCFHKGKSTGFIIPEFIKHDGALGSLLNHSEHRISKEEIKKTLSEAKKAKLKILLCVENLKEAKLYSKFKPWALAFEDKKLIGSGKSITSQKSSDVKAFAEFCKRKKIIPICGAGVSTAEDVKAAKSLGCKGVLIASAIADSKNPKKLLKELSLLN